MSQKQVLTCHSIVHVSSGLPIWEAVEESAEAQPDGFLNAHLLSVLKVTCRENNPTSITDFEWNTLEAPLTSVTG